MAETSPEVWRFVADFVQEWGFSARHYLRHFARLLDGKECTLWAISLDETTAAGHVVSLERMQMVQPV